MTELMSSISGMKHIMIYKEEAEEEKKKRKLSLIKFLFETIQKMGRRNQNSRAKEGMANYIPSFFYFFYGEKKGR